jgi:hypothetical protein
MGTIRMTFVIIIIYRELILQKERNKEKVFDSRAMSLSNKNRSVRVKNMRRHEGGRRIRLFCRYMCPL